MGTVKADVKALNKQINKQSYLHVIPAPATKVCPWSTFPVPPRPAEIWKAAGQILHLQYILKGSFYFILIFLFSALVKRLFVVKRR